MPEHKEPDQPMRLLAIDCNHLFQRFIDACPATQHEICSQAVEYRDAFTALTSFLCIFNEPDSCLDYRLRRHEAIQDIMIRLLELLRQNLFIVSDSVSSMKSDLSLQAVPEVGEALTGIKDSLTSLNKFAITIRQSSRSSALTLARNFATSKRYLEDLEELILITLENLYPNAPESLRNHICNTLTDRYARLQYDANLNGASRSKSSKQNEGGQATEKPSAHEPIQQSSIISRPKTVEFDHIQKKAQEESPNVPQRPLSSLDTGLLRQSFNNKDVKTSQSKRTLSVYESDSHLHEPMPPKFKAGEAEVRCKWCNEFLDRSVVRNNRWSNIGRLHYKRDLKPFPCLSETCGESRPSFQSRKQWLEHMRLKHSTTWPQSLFGEAMWVCRDHNEDGESIPYAFSSRDDLEQHMLLIHHSKKRLSDIELTKHLEHRPLPNGALPPSACPLCFFAVEASVESKKASPSKSGANIPEEPGRIQSNRKDGKRVSSGVRFAPDVKEASDIDAGDDIDIDSSTVFAMELHIAAHLQYLLVMSLRLVEMLDQDTDEEPLTGLPGSNDPATGSASSRNDVSELDAWSDKEIASVYISESERLELENMRANEEAAEYVLPSYDQNQWDDFDGLVQGRSEGDSIIQDLSRKLESRSRIAVLRKSIERLRHESYDVLAEGDRWREIGALEMEIYRESRDLGDLEQAIEATQQGVEASPDWKGLGDLSFYLFEKCRIAPSRSDLDTAIEITRKATGITDDSDRHQPMELCIRLSSLHRWRYSETGKDEDLTQALDFGWQATESFLEDSTRRGKQHNNLGQLLTLDYWRTGIETTLDEAIHKLRLGLNNAIEEDTDYSEYLATLSAGLNMKFAISGSLEELDEAMKLIRRSISLTSERDSTFVGRLNSLTIMLGELFTKTGALDALEESIQIARTVVTSTPETDPNSADRMAHLADRLEDMFEKTGAMRDIEEAIHLSTEAITLSTKDHPRHHVYGYGLAAKILKRFSITGSVHDLLSAVDYSTEALKLVPDTNVNMAMYMCLLGDVMSMQYEMSREPSWPPKIHSLYESAVSHPHSALQYRLLAGRRLFHIEVRGQNWDDAYKAARMTIDCLTYLPFADLEHTDKKLILQTTGWISSEGVAAALNAARPPFEVISLLEASRCLEANSGVYCQEEFERLRQEHPSKLDEFLAIREDLKRPISVPSSRFNDSSPWNAQAKRRYQATIDCERLLTEIRNEPDFFNWLAHDDETTALQVGSEGPVVVLTASRLRCDAIIIHRDTIEVVSLPDLDYEELSMKVEDRKYFTVATSLWIWETIAKPVTAHLGLSPAPSGNYPRLWLIPTGLLTNLPIHTAGDYRDPQSESMSMLDHAVCSYSPSIKALRVARERPAVVPDNARALLLSIEESPGFARLKYAAKEISTLHDICRSRGLEVSQPNSKEGILQALGSCELFHFAAMFIGSREDPFKSHLLLADGSITVKGILYAISQAPSPFLAYLSGCETAKTLQEDFADECLHAAGALHIGGFRHAIGALGMVSDRFCYDFSSLFYRAWSNRGLSDATVASCLHEVTRRLRDQWKERGLGSYRGDTHRAILTFDDDDDTMGLVGLEWAVFVHLGP